MPRRERERVVPRQEASEGLDEVYEEDAPGPDRGWALLLHEPGGGDAPMALVEGLLAAGLGTVRVVPEPGARGLAGVRRLYDLRTGRERGLRVLVGQGAAAPLALALAAEWGSHAGSLVLLGAPAHPRHVADKTDWEEVPDPLDSARGLAVPMLLLHDPEDRRVPVHDARLLFRAAPHPRSFLAVPGAGDGFRDATAAGWAMEVAARWAVAQRPAPDGGLPHGQVRVSARETLQNHVVAGRHELLADEPRELGGFDSGPAPHEWVLGGLGACTSMTLRMYADRKGWPLRRVQVDLEIDRRPRKEGPRTVVDSTIRRVIHLEGNLDEAQRARLLEIAERCPVHRTLTGTIAIDSRLAAPPSVDRLEDPDDGREPDDTPGCA